MSYILTLAQDDDIAVIRRLNQSILEENYPARWWRENYNKKSPFIIARHSSSSKIVGYIATYPMKDKWVIFSIGISSQHQNKGLGTSLLSNLIDRASTILHSCKVPRLLTLHVRVTNERAIHIYRKLGFQDVKIIPKYYQNEIDAIKMSYDM
jgi:ribosomal-protein-alanine N-acetyltransferase